MLISIVYEFFVACQPKPGSTIVEDNVLTGFIGLGVILVAFIIHMIINKKIFKKAWHTSLILYIFIFSIQGLLMLTTGMGDCGFMFAGGAKLFSILSIFWLIIVPILRNYIQKYKKDKLSTTPFANPVEDE